MDHNTSHYLTSQELFSSFFEEEIKEKDRQGKHFTPTHPNHFYTLHLASAWGQNAEASPNEDVQALEIGTDDVPFSSRNW